jgi:hypothetical protein
MATERFVARLDVTLRRRDGTSLPAVLSASRRRDSQDRLLGYQWVIREEERARPRADRPVAADTVVAADEADRTDATAGVDVDRAEAPDAEPSLAVPPEYDLDESDGGAIPAWVNPLARPSAESAIETSLDAVFRDASPSSESSKRGQQVVLLVGGHPPAQRDCAQALERAGFAVLQEPDGTGAIRALRTHADAVDVAVVTGQGDEKAEDIARDLVALSHRLRLVLVLPDDELTPPGDLAGSPVLREPGHPLALLQAVRGVLAERIV